MCFILMLHIFPSVCLYILFAKFSNENRIWSLSDHSAYLSIVIVNFVFLIQSTILDACYYIFVFCDVVLLEFYF